jgi:cytochrome c-type biogenesis protein CcmH/NrfG
MESKKVRFFNRLSFVTLFATVFGSLFFFIPFIPVTLEASKGFLLSVGMTLSVFFWLIARLGEGKFSVPKDRIILFAGLIPLVFFVASLFSSSLYISLFGRGFEIGTFGSMLVLFILFFLSTLYFQGEKRMKYFFGGLFLAAFILAVFELINLFIGFGAVGPRLLQGVSSGNLVGSWNDFALFFGLVVLLSMFTLEFLHTKGIFKVLQYFLLVVGIFFLIILNIPLVWLLVGLFSIIISVYSISVQRAGAAGMGEGGTKKFPFAGLIVLFICLIFLIGSNSIGSLISRYINIANTDVRPSLVTTAQIAGKALRHNPFFGTGPNTFVIDWALWQPKDIAQTVFWNVDFDNGIGLLPTFLVTTGLLGFAAFVLFMFTYLMRAAGSLRVALRDTSSNYYIVTTLMVSIYAWITVVFYTPNIVMLVLAFASSGALIAMLVEKRSISSIHMSFLDDPRNSFFAILGIIILMITAIATTYLYAEKFASVIYFSKSLKAENTMVSLSTSERMLSNAIALDKNDIYYRTLSQVYIREIGLVISDKTISQDTLKSTVQQLVNLASQSASLAVAQNPKQYLNYVNLGDVYSSLVPLAIANSYESAVVAYGKAHDLAPNNPSILLSRASLEYAHKNNTESQKFINQALTLKGDYTDAIFLSAQIQTDAGNVSEAIKQAEYAGSVSPNDPTIFFRLGLLRYNNSDYTGAVSAFEKAVILDNRYLNARFFLAQSYKKAGRSSDSLVQFKILAKLLPDNQDIKDAIAGFDGGTAAAPAASTSKTPTLPLKGKQ